jgi:hypothetical protein
MGFSLGQLDAIETAIAAGVTRVSYDGKSTEYRSLDEMMRIRDIIQRALGLVPTGSASVFAAHSRGFVGGSSEGP